MTDVKLSRASVFAIFKNNSNVIRNCKRQLDIESIDLFVFSREPEKVESRLVPNAFDIYLLRYINK